MIVLTCDCFIAFSLILMRIQLSTIRDSEKLINNGGIPLQVHVFFPQSEEVITWYHFFCAGPTAFLWWVMFPRLYTILSLLECRLVTLNPSLRNG